MLDPKDKHIFDTLGDQIDELTTQRDTLLTALKDLYHNCEAAGKYLDKAHEAIKAVEGE